MIDCQISRKHFCSVKLCLASDSWLGILVARPRSLADGLQRVNSLALGAGVTERVLETLSETTRTGYS